MWEGNVLHHVKRDGELSARWGTVPYLFAIYIDSLVEIRKGSGIWIWLLLAPYTCISIILYADDVLLLAPSVSSLQLILSVCEKELHRLDMMINVKQVRQ